jgi:hypothetical protein
VAGFDVRHVIAGVHARAAVWEEAGVRWSFIAGSGTDGSVASMTCETGRVVVNLTVRAGGDATMQVVGRAGKLSSLFYYHLTDADDVATCLDELTRQLVPSV